MNWDGEVETKLQEFCLASSNSSPRVVITPKFALPESIKKHGALPELRACCLLQADASLCHIIKK